MNSKHQLIGQVGQTMYTIFDGAPNEDPKVVSGRLNMVGMAEELEAKNPEDLSILTRTGKTIHTYTLLIDIEQFKGSSLHKELSQKARYDHDLNLTCARISTVSVYTSQAEAMTRIQKIIASKAQV